MNFDLRRPLLPPALPPRLLRREDGALQAVLGSDCSAGLGGHPPSTLCRAEAAAGSRWTDVGSPLVRDLEKAASLMPRPFQVLSLLACSPASGWSGFHALTWVRGFFYPFAPKSHPDPRE